MRSGGMRRQICSRQFITELQSRHLHVSPVKTVTLLPRGAHCNGFVGPKQAMVGIDRAAARCVMPESCPIYKRACEMDAATVDNSASLRTGTATSSRRWTRSTSRPSDGPSSNTGNVFFRFSHSTTGAMCSTFIHFCILPLPGWMITRGWEYPQPRF